MQSPFVILHAEDDATLNSIKKTVLDLHLKNALELIRSHLHTEIELMPSKTSWLRIAAKFSMNLLGSLTNINLLSGTSMHGSFLESFIKMINYLGNLQ